MPEFQIPARDEELSKKRKIREKLLELYADIDKGFLDSSSRINDILDYWDIYNCDIGYNQFYTGNSQIFVPLVKNAIDARVTRFVNQIFPSSGRCVEAVTPDGDTPLERVALLEHYTLLSRLRDQVVPAVLRNGDVEGHWNLYVTWNKRKRIVVSKTVQTPTLDGIPMPEIGDADLEVDTVEEQELDESGPCVEVIPDTDVLVLPAIADTLEDALAAGGSVTILRRWSKAAIRRMIEDGEFVEKAGEALLDAMIGKDNPQRKDLKKEHADSAGTKSSGKYVLGYETWTRLKIGDEWRLCRVYYGGSDIILGCKLNPYWCDLIPLISAPQSKISGVFKGTSLVKAVQSLQYQANDWINQGADSATYGLMPIIMTDPISNPRVGTMVLDLAAVWEVDPNKTKFAEFPQFWKDALELVMTAKSEIFQTLNVNPSMIPGSTGGKKRSQAEVANEQQVDVLTTADVVTAFEASILTPLIQRFAWYDSQFRDYETTIRCYGRDGFQMEMQQIPPFQMNTRYWFRWLGVETARNTQQVQQQIAAMNVLRGIPPQLYDGYKLDLVPILRRVTESAFGARLAPQIFKSLREQLSIEPEAENDMLRGGFDLPVSPFDDDMQHMRVHGEAAQQGDPHGTIREHLMKHQMQMAARRQQAAQQAQLSQQGAQGVPGGAGPGVAGSPRMGAQPGQPRMQGPPGMIHQDQMPLSAPRKF